MCLLYPRTIVWCTYSSFSRRRFIVRINLRALKRGRGVEDLLVDIWYKKIIPMKYIYFGLIFVRLSIPFFINMKCHLILTKLIYEHKSLVNIISSCQISLFTSALMPRPIFTGSSCFWFGTKSFPVSLVAFSFSELQKQCLFYYLLVHFQRHNNWKLIVNHLGLPWYTINELYPSNKDSLVFTLLRGIKITETATCANSYEHERPLSSIYIYI